MLTARLSSRTLLEAEITLAPGNHSLVMELAKLNQDIAQADFEVAQDMPIKLNDQEQIDYSNKCQDHSRRISTLETHRGQAYSLILGQCTQLLQDKMKQDASWTMVSASYNPLELYRLIKQVVLKQTKDQYPFAVVHKQSLAVLNTKQGGLSNRQWYECFNTQHDIARSVGVELGHKVLWEYCDGGGCLPIALMDMAFKQSMKGLQGFDLRRVILLNNQLTVDIFCNKEFVSNIRPAPEPLILKSNGGELITHHITNVADYDESVWFSKKAITNIFMLKNMKKQYRVTYDSSEETFLVHCEAAGLPNLFV
jgi:hypothetical protein